MNQQTLIKSLRKRTGLSQSKFAKAVGVATARISEYENEKHQISLSKFLDWCGKFNVNFKEL